jgi:hypothetical protein
VWFAHWPIEAIVVQGLVPLLTTFVLHSEWLGGWSYST